MAGEAVSDASRERFFDLNIQQLLEHWTIADALREIIANALDEQGLTGTEDPQIYRDEDEAWHIRDFGRGLRYEHFTQNEDAEKLSKPGLVIGKFGVGLKDAMALFERHGVGVEVRSRHAEITLANVAKHGFGDVETLHAVVKPPDDPGMAGTEFIFSGISDKDVAVAKDFFLRYSGDTVIDGTRYGSVLQRETDSARIYVNGLRVAEEPNFLFSYNITSLTKSLRAALNRERSNVGRQAYSDRVKGILLASTASGVADPLIEDLAAFERGDNHDETAWIDVGLHACKIANAHQRVVFVTAMQMHVAGAMVARARDDGNRVVVVPETLARRLPEVVDVAGNAMRDLNEYVNEWNDSFEYDFVSIEELDEGERAIFALAGPLRGLLREEVQAVKEILVSRTMRIDSVSSHEVVGVWDPATRHIVIRRDQLASAESFVSTLLHEVGHAFSQAPDRNELFEVALTHLLGRTGVVAARNTEP